MMQLLEQAAAVHRLSRLVVVDSIAEPLRDRWVRGWYQWNLLPVPERQPFKELAVTAMEDEQHPKIIELATCVHCVGVWAALVVLVLYRWRWGRLLVRLLAASGVHSAWSEMTG